MMFPLTPRGGAVLLQGTAADVLLASAMAAVGVAALAVSAGGYFRGPAAPVARALAAGGGLLMFSADPRAGAAGLAVLAVAALWQARARRRPAT
jgi:TRAP-type uncharacterized transport system fused permease subunit